MSTETKIVILTVAMLAVAVVVWAGAAWWSAGRYEEIISDLEDERDELTRRAWMLAEDLGLAESAALAEAVQVHPAGCHLRPVEDVPWDEHAEIALAVVADEVPAEDLSVTGWTAKMAADMDEFISSIASYGTGP